MVLATTLGSKSKTQLMIRLLFVPPSVVALGTYSSAQRDSELWFAPAGFTRGGLTEGSAGIASYSDSYSFDFQGT